jgi:hypothetical protein
MELVSLASVDERWIALTDRMFFDTAVHRQKSMEKSKCATGLTRKHTVLLLSIDGISTVFHSFNQQELL